MAVCPLNALTGDKLAECILTEDDGSFRLTVTEGADVVLSAVLPGHTFRNQNAPENTGGVIFIPTITETQNVQIIDTTTMDARVHFGGGLCLHHLGQVNITFRAETGNSKCDLASDLVLSKAAEVLRFPAMNYVAEFVHLEPVAQQGGLGIAEITNDRVLNYFNSADPDLQVLVEEQGVNRTLEFDPTSNVSALLEWHFHVVPKITVKCPGCDIPFCENQPPEESIMVMTNLNTYAVDFQLEEIFYVPAGGSSARTCKIVPGFIDIAESVSESNSRQNYDLEILTGTDGRPRGSGKLTVSIEAGYIILVFVHICGFNM